MGSRLTLIVGLPGAWIGRPVHCLEKHGWQVRWPGQDLDVAAGPDRYADGENIAVIQMHESILRRAKCNWLTSCAPRWYDRPYPGPAEFVGMFSADASIVVADPRLCFFLPLWGGLYRDLIHYEIPFEESLRWVQGSLGEQAGLDEAEAVVHHYEERLRENLAGFPSVFRLDHAEVCKGQVEAALAPFLKTGF